MADNGVLKLTESSDPSTLSSVASGDAWAGIDASGLWFKKGSTVSRPNFGNAVDDILGWVSLTDSTYTSGAPFALTASTDTYLDFNMDSSIDTYAPDATVDTDYFDDTNNRILTTAVGNAYVLRVTFKCVPSNNSRVLNITHDIGASLGAKIPIDKREVSLRTSGVATDVSITNLIYSLDTFNTNGMAIILNATTNCDIYDITMVLSRVK